MTTQLEKLYTELIGKPAPKRKLAKAQKVLTGIEYEFYISGYAGKCTCDNWYDYNDCPKCWGVTEYNYMNVYTFPEGWDAGDDEPCAEIRSDGPHPLGEQVDLCRKLVTKLRRIKGIEINNQCSFHVHINTNSTIGPAVDAHKLYHGWEAVKEYARTLVNDPDRLHAEWNTPLDVYFEDMGLPDLPPLRSKETELSRSTFGTIELRLWDATMSVNLIKKRINALNIWIASCL